MNGYSEVASDFCACCGSTEGRIEIHHIQRRSQGGGDEAHNLIALCKSCHHLTDGHFLRFYRDDEDALWWERDDHYGRCVFPDECRQEECPEALDEADGETLAEYERLLVGYLEDANRAMWKASKIAREAYLIFFDAYPGKQGMARYKEWASELRDEYYRLRPIAPSTARDMAITAALPDEDAIADMTLRERVRLVKALAADADYDEARDDVYALSREDFEAKHLGRPTWIEGDK
jgi:hypothetical protein